MHTLSLVANVLTSVAHAVGSTLVHDVPGTVAPRVAIFRPADLREPSSVPSSACVGLLPYQLQPSTSPLMSGLVFSGDDVSPRSGGEVAFLVTAFDVDADAELRLLERALHALEDTPLLMGARLLPSSAWGADAHVEVTRVALPTDLLVSVTTAVLGTFRLSVPYVARVGGGS